MHAREFETVAGSTLTIGPGERGRRGSVTERLGHMQTPDVKDEMPEFKNAMRWPSVEDITARAPLPPGYHYQYLDRQQVLSLIAALKAWYPGIVVGNASCHLRESFYADKVCLDGQLERDFLVVLFKQDDELVGVFSVERDVDSEVLYGRIGAISPKHRGSRLSRNILLLQEALGRAMGMGMVYGLGNTEASAHASHFRAHGVAADWHYARVRPRASRAGRCEARVRSSLRQGACSRGTLAAASTGFDT